MRWLALAVLGVLLPGCLQAYPGFDANAYNATATTRRVTLEVLPPGSDDWVRFEGTAEAGQSLDFGRVSQREGTYEVRFRVDSGPTGNATQDFAHDLGPGGVTLFISADDDAELDFWYH
jgi:hypothetical protein